MPKPKDGLALFEIMRSSEPRGKNKEADPPGQRAREPAPSGPPAAEHQPSTVTGSVTAVPAGHDRPAGDVSPQPWFKVAGGQVRFALTSQAMAVAIFGLGLLALAAYAVGVYSGELRGKEAGYRDGKRDTQAVVMDDIQAARAEPPAQTLFDGVGSSPIVYQGTEPDEPAADRQPTTPDGAAWVRGYTYVVVQDFRADTWADVERAQQYLLENGIETAVVELEGDWRYRLIAAQGFNRDDPVQRKLADDFLARTREVGEAYFRAGGRYRLEGYFKKLTADHW